MDKAFDEIFAGIEDVVRANLEDDGNREAVAERLGGSGSIKVDFTLDANGNYKKTVKKKGYGVTIDFTFVIDDPDAAYDVAVSSSDGGGGSWKNVKVGDKCSGKIKTSLWHATKITIDLHASVTSTSGHARLNYSY